MLSMPNVRASSATIGTTRGPSSLSRSSALKMRTTAIVVDISLPAASTAKFETSFSAGTAMLVDVVRRAGKPPPSAARRSRK